MIAGHYLGSVEAAGQDDGEAGRQFAQSSQCFPAIHARHGHIANHASDFILVLPEHFHSLDTISRQEHRKTKACEGALAEFAHHRFVFN